MGLVVKILIGLGLLAAVLLPMIAGAHETEILKCSKNLIVTSVSKVGDHINENGTISELYDRNGDGKLDIEAISYITDQQLKDDGSVEFVHQDHPFLYVVDLDLDGQPDAAYIDKSGVGTCDDIVLYQDLNEPGSAAHKGEAGQL